MAKAALLFNGIKYPFGLIDRAISWAQQSNGVLLGIFLRAGKEKSESYLWPSDLDEAESLSSEDEAWTGNARIIDSNIRMLEHQAAFAHVNLETLLLTNPHSKELISELKQAEVLFTEEHMFEPGLLTVNNLNIRHLLKELSIKIEMVKGDH